MVHNLCLTILNKRLQWMFAQSSFMNSIKTLTTTVC